MTETFNQNIHDRMANEHKIVKNEVPLEYLLDTFLCMARHQAVDVKQTAVRDFNYCPFCGREVNPDV